MPIATEPDDFSPRYANEHDYAQPQEPPSFGSVMGAAFRQDNPIVSLMADKTRQAFPWVEGYSPADDIKTDDPYFAHRERFVASRSPAETTAIKRQIDQEEGDRRIRAASGTAGTIAGLVAGAVDPTMYWAPVRLGRGLLAGRTLLRGAAEGAMTFGAQAAMQEAELHASQQTRTPSESAENISGAVILGALLGPAAKMLSKEEHAALATRIDADRAATARHMEGLPPEEVPAEQFEGSQSAPLDAPTVASPGAPAEVRTPPAQEMAGHAELGGEPLAQPPAAPQAHSPADALHAAGNDRAAFDAAMEDVRSLKKADVDEVAKAYTLSQREKWPTKTEALEAIENSFRQRSHQEAFRNNFAPAGAQATYDPETVHANLPQPGAQVSSSIKEGLAIAPAFGLEKWKADPKLELINSPFPAARRIGAELGETPFLTRGNLKGETTTERGGAPTETLLKMYLRDAHTGIMGDMRDAHKDMVWGGTQQPWYSRFKEHMGMNGQPAHMPTYEDFTKMVGEAMTRGDVHPIPQVQQAAQAIRKRMQPWAERAAANDTLKGFKLREGEPYFPHDWNKKLIAEQRPEFADFLTNFFEGEQRTKQALQSRLKGLSEELDKLEKQTKPLAERKDLTEAAQQKLDDALLRIEDIRSQIEEAVGKWSGKSSKEAKAAIRARDKLAAERQRKAAAAGKAANVDRGKGADTAIDDAVKRILESKTDRTTDELRERAHKTIHQIMGTPDGRIYGEGGDFGGSGVGNDLRGSEQHRTLDISNAEAFPWIEQNAEKAAKKHLDTLIPDVVIAERYGDVTMRSAMQQIAEQHDSMSDAARGNPKQIKELHDAMDRAIARVVFMRDKMRGTFNVPANEMEKMVRRGVGIAKNYNVLTSLGMSGMNSITDSGNVMMNYGMMHTFADGFFPYVRSLMSGGELNAEVMRQSKAAGISVDWELATRHRSLADIVDNHAHGSTLERALQWGADKMQVLNLQAPWTDRIKAITFQIAAPEMKRGMEALLAGTATKKQKILLGTANINEALARKIIAQYDKHGVDVDGVHLPNVTEWTDRTAREAFQGALIREADTVVVTPGIGDAGMWMSHPVLGALGQFKQFTAAAHTRILLANLQRRDSEALSGLVGAIGMGMLAYKIGSMTGGSPTSDNPADWVKEGISRSSALGWLEEGNALASKMTRGRLDMYQLVGSNHPMSRYAGRSVADQLLGPTLGKIERISQITGAASSGDWKSSDTHALRQLIALQNLIWLRGALNEVEHGFNSPMGVEEKSQ